jgi:hypothetical protein
VPESLFLRVMKYKLVPLDPRHVHELKVLRAMVSRFPQREYLWYVAWVVVQEGRRK